MRITPPDNIIVLYIKAHRRIGVEAGCAYVVLGAGGGGEHVNNTMRKLSVFPNWTLSYRTNICQADSCER